MADPAWSNVKLLLHCDGGNGSTTFTDSSLNGCTITRRNGAAQSTGATLFGSSCGKLLALDTGVGVNGACQILTQGSDFQLDATGSLGCAEGFFQWPALSDVTLFTVAQCLIFYDSQAGKIKVTGTIGGAGSTSAELAVSLATNTRYYFGAQWDWDAGTLTVRYGTSGATTLVGVVSFKGGAGNNTITIGGDPLYNPFGTPTTHTGDVYFDEIRWVKGETVSISTVPTAPFPTLSTSVGAASGTGAASGVGRATKVGAGSASGAAAVSGVGSPRAIGIGAVTGQGAATATGKSTAAATGAAAGTATLAGDGSSTAQSTGAASATGAAAATGSSTYTVSGSASGTATVSGVAVGTAVSTGLASGIGAANGAAIPPMVGVAAGTGTASAAGLSTASSVGLAMGFGSCIGFWRMDTVYPRTVYPVTFGKPIGPNNDVARVVRPVSPVRINSPTSFHITP